MKQAQGRSLLAVCNSEMLSGHLGRNVNRQLEMLSLERQRDKN